MCGQALRWGPATAAWEGGMLSPWERSGISLPASGGLVWEQRPLRDSCEDGADLLRPLAFKWLFL